MEEKVKLTIDGKEVEVPAGLTIMEAADSIGIYIPHLCYNPTYKKFLLPSSSCRICVVEVEGMKNLIASCSYPVSSGMVVRTNSERVQKARRVTLELLLSSHPMDCMTCEISGRCELEKVAYELGVPSSSFQGERVNYPIDTSNPFIIRDYNKCILCGRCVAACAEIQYNNAIDFSNRGFRTKIATAYDRPLQESTCEFCGRCVSVCPVGALTEKMRRGRGREWELKKFTTICPYCGCGCTIELNVKDNKIVKITADPFVGINEGSLCVKGKFGYDFVSHPDRLKMPLIKKDGKFVECRWEEALKYTADKLKELKERYGPDAIAGLSSAKCTNEENYLFQKFMRAVTGTNNVDHCARLCHASTVAGLAKAFGSGAMTNSIAELEDAKCILVTGSNTSEAHPIIALRIKAAVKRNGAKLIVADPRKIDMVRFACIHLQHRPGTDVALFNGMMNVILKEGLQDKEFIKNRTEGFDEFKKVVEKYDPQIVERITGVPEEKIIEAARVYATSKPAAIVYSMGITQHTTGTDNVLTLANLAMLTGNIGKESSGVNPLRGQNNVQGACDMGALPNLLPGYLSIIDENARKKFADAWGRDIPAKPGLTVVEMMHAARKGILKGMYIMGENPFLSDPNANEVRKALEKLEFLVVQDIFLSETAEYANVVFPAVSFAEKDGTFTNTERRVQRIRKIIEPPGEAKPDWQIICLLSEKMGYEMKYENPSEIMAEIGILVPSYGGITYDRIERKGLQWPCPDKNHPGTPVLHREKFTRGKGLFSPVEYIAPVENPDAEYPFVLTTGRVLYHYHTGTMTRHSQGLNEIYPQGVVEINPEDAVKLHINTGDMVEVSSRRGSVKVKAEISERPLPGVVFMTFHFKEAAANLLTIDALDPVAKIPEFKVCAVRINGVRS